MISFRKAFSVVICTSIIATSVISSQVFAAQNLISADFETGLDDFAARASESVERTNADAFDGSYALAVTNRTEAWNGPVVALGSNFVAGETYAFSCAVKQVSGGSVTMQMSLQYNDSMGTTNYAQIVTDSVASGSWTTLANTAYQLPSGASNMYLYVETTEDLCDFYVDSVIASAPSHYRMGDVNQDERITKEDVQELMKFLQGKDANVMLESADMDKNGKLDARDLSQLRRLFIYPELTATTTTTTVTTTTTTKAPAAAGGGGYMNGNAWVPPGDASWINPSKPMVAISFDDGPIGLGNTTASRIHDALTKNGFHATFFYWGNKINGNNENEIKQAYERGFEVANHTYTHTNLTSLSGQQIQNEYNQCAEILRRITGQKDYLVRLPYLGQNQTVTSNIPTPMPNCGIDTKDWDGAQTNQIVGTLQSAMNNGSLNGKVVLCHENYDTTASAMEQFLPTLKANGWQCVTVSEMFAANGKTMYKGQVYDYVR